MLSLSPDEAIQRLPAFRKLLWASNESKKPKECWVLAKYMKEMGLDGCIMCPENPQEENTLEPADLNLKLNKNSLIEPIQITRVTTLNENMSLPHLSLENDAWVTGSVEPWRTVINYLQNHQKLRKYSELDKKKLNFLIYWDTRGVILDSEEYGIPHLENATEQFGFKRVLLVTNTNAHHLAGPILGNV